MRFILASILSLALTFGAAAVGAQDFHKGSMAFGVGDYGAALQEWRPLAEQGNADAQNNLGLMYHKGWGVTKDNAEAAKWLRLASAQGIVSAHFLLARLYHTGAGVPENFNKAMKLYRLAADQGHAKSQGNLGVMYLDGRGVLQNYKEAEKWLACLPRKEMQTLRALLVSCI